LTLSNNKTVLITFIGTPKTKILALTRLLSNGIFAEKLRFSVWASTVSQIFYYKTEFFLEIIFCWKSQNINFGQTGSRKPNHKILGKFFLLHFRIKHVKLGRVC